MMKKRLVLVPFEHCVNEFSEGLAITVEDMLYFVDHEDYDGFVAKVSELGIHEVEKMKQEAYLRGQEVNWN